MINYVIKSNDKSDVATFINDNYDKLIHFNMRTKESNSQSLYVLNFTTDNSFSIDQLTTIVSDAKYSDSIAAEAAPLQQ
jgi:hypothetical protein